MQRKPHKVTFQPIDQLVKSFEITNNVFGIVASGECGYEHRIINSSKQRAPSFGHPMNEICNGGSGLGPGSHMDL